MPKYLYPAQPAAGGLVSLPGGGSADRAFAATWQASPIVGAVATVMAALTDDGAEAVVTTFDAQPDYPRTITATSSGTAGDIGAIQVIVTGTDANGAVLTETLPIFTADSGTTVTSVNAFASVTSVTIPAHDGTGATTSIGCGNALGLNGAFDTNPVVPGMSWFDGSVEGTDPTVVVNAVMSKNFITFNSTLDGSAASAVLVF